MIRGLHHNAYRCREAEETRRFYEDFLGLPLAGTLEIKETKSGLPTETLHIFFGLDDGSYLAFFEAPGVPPPSKASHPAYDIFNHIALEAKDRAEVLRWYDWLKSQGVDVIGPTDHKGLILSIYFHDPAGIRLEITTPLDKEWNRHTEKGYADLKLWEDAKAKAKAEGRDVPAALLELIKDVRKRYE